MIEIKNKNNKKAFISTAVLSLSLFLTACGGGGDESVAGSGGEGGIIGTAKVVVKASEVKVKAKGGNSFKATIGSTGKYKLSGLAEDSYLLRVKSGSTFVYSVAHVSKGQTVTSNSHALTDLIIRNWFKQNSLDIDSEFEGSQVISDMPTVGEVNEIETALEGIVSELLKESGLNSGVNLVGNTFEDTDNDNFSNFLNNNQVVINNNEITLIFTGDEIQTVSIDGVNINTDFTNDSDKPKVPSNVRALPSKVNEIVVVWEPSTDSRGVAGYDIYRNGALIRTTPYPVYSDGDVLSGTNYEYAIVAIDGAGNRSALSSSSSSVMTLSSPDTVAEGLANNLVVTANGNDLVLGWDLSGVGDIAKFIVKRGTNGMIKSEIAYTTANSFTDFNLPTGNYCYTVLTQDAAGNKSAESAEMCGLVNTSGGTISCNSYTTIQETTIETDTTLSAGCYKADNDLYVEGGATLTISPSVRIEFANGKELRVRDDGAMNAVGTASSPIIFTGQEKTAGYWDGVTYYGSNNFKNELKHVTVEYGGGTTANLNIDSSSRIKLSNSTIRQSSTYGIDFDGNAIIDEFSNNIITENSSAPVRIYANLIGSLDDESIYSGNASNREYISVNEFSDVTDDQTWKNLTVPYLLENNSVEAVLTINPGTSLIFREGGNFRIEREGTLIARGTASNRISFTGQNKTPGAWHGIQFTFSGTANELDYVDVEYGGRDSGNGDGAVSVFSTPGRLKIHNSTISNSLQYGLDISEDDHAIDFSNVTLTDNQNGSLLIHPNLLGDLDKLSTYNDPIVLESNANFEVDLTIQNLGVEYIANSHSIRSNVDIEAGTTFTFKAGGDFSVQTQGSLSAIGTAASPITFTAKNQIIGYWEGIEYLSGSFANKLDHVVVEYAGSPGGLTEGLVGVFSNDARVDVTNSILRYSATNGLWLYDGTAGTHSSNIFEGINGDDVFVDNP